MSKNYKVLGQSAPAGTVSTELYVVPAATTSIISTLAYVNRDVSGITAAFRVAVVPAGQVLGNKHYIEYEKLVETRGSGKITIGVSLASGDKIYVQSDTGNVSFSLFGVEIT